MGGSNRTFRDTVFLPSRHTLTRSNPTANWEGWLGHSRTAEWAAQGHTDKGQWLAQNAGSNRHSATTPVSQAAPKHAACSSPTTDWIGCLLR